MSEENHVVKKDGEFRLDKVEEAVSRIDSERMEDILSNFENFISYLHNRVDVAKAIGLSEEQMAKTAERIADYLADHVEPKNREEKLLQELWKVGNQEERHSLAHLLVKLASNSDPRNIH
ncbi:MAG TPA: DUF3243 domain-containing protein [Chondromyces sp.]|nr:DUF3243 domain-containing protein [Chondromyces sp.]